MKTITANSNPKEPYANNDIVIPKLPLLEKLIGLIKVLIGKLINLSKIYENKNIDRTIKIADRIISFSKKTEDSNLIRVLKIKQGAPIQVIIFVISVWFRLLPILFHIYPTKIIIIIGIIIGNN
tara:strand:+ start:405 stop:776 length:372 start_codon:yes stop_codon:yes gene_type:complete